MPVAVELGEGLTFCEQKDARLAVRATRLLEGPLALSYEEREFIEEAVRHLGPLRKSCYFLNEAILDFESLKGPLPGIKVAQIGVRQTIIVIRRAPLLVLQAQPKKHSPKLSQSPAKPKLRKDLYRTFIGSVRPTLIEKEDYKSIAQ